MIGLLFARNVTWRDVRFAPVRGARRKKAPARTASPAPVGEGPRGANMVAPDAGPFKAGAAAGCRCSAQPGHSRGPVLCYTDGCASLRRRQSHDVEYVHPAASPRRARQPNLTSNEMVLPCLATSSPRPFAIDWRSSSCGCRPLPFSRPAAEGVRCPRSRRRCARSSSATVTA